MILFTQYGICIQDQENFHQIMEVIWLWLHGTQEADPQ